MRLEQLVNEIKPRYHARGGAAFGLTESQCEAHVDLTFAAALRFLQPMMMSGKLAELKSLMSAGPEAIQQSPLKAQLVEQCTQSYYGLTWEKSRKEELALSILEFLLLELQADFQRGGYSADAAGVMKFLGMDAGLLGKMGGLFGKWF
ncbi:MAG: hypothetical protein ACO3DK_05905 [Bacteroidia bacterium]